MKFTPHRIDLATGNVAGTDTFRRGILAAPRSGIPALENETGCCGDAAHVRVGNATEAHRKRGGPA